ncbi:MAG TPA: hypothetical protein VL485_19580 [Ktedonobacteraceae bacterium]|nr:hypothetical protein [Ktedonobacteraceae bacterium]
MAQPFTVIRIDNISSYNYILHTLTSTTAALPLEDCNMRPVIEVANLEIQAGSKIGEHRT